MKASETSRSDIRTVEFLVSAIQSGWSPDWLFFWGHRPSKDGSLSKSCFSQWWAGHAFEIDGATYPTAEHYMMAEKARLFGDHAMRDAVLRANSPGEAKKLGRAVSGFDEEAWLQHRWEIVVRGNEAKFLQHPELGALLLRTGQRVLVEASPRDRVWGIGLGASHADAERPSNWRGLNLLGFALMEVRAQLQLRADAHENLSTAL
jgi:ribA/ribD-fused uncharacterized protein